MNRRIIVLDEAEDELIAAQEWYEAQRPGLGGDFRSAIDEAMDRLLKAQLASSSVIDLPASMGVRDAPQPIPVPGFACRGRR